MKEKELKVGETIARIKKYGGEGEFIIAEICEDYLKGIISCNTKTPNLNGTIENIQFDRLKHFELVED